MSGTNKPILILPSFHRKQFHTCVKKEKKNGSGLLLCSLLSCNNHQHQQKGSALSASSAISCLPSYCYTHSHDTKINMQKKHTAKKLPTMNRDTGPSPTIKDRFRAPQLLDISQRYQQYQNISNISISRRPQHNQRHHQQLADQFSCAASGGICSKLLGRHLLSSLSL